MFDIRQKSKYTKKYKPGTKFHWSSPHHNGFPEMLPCLRPYPDAGGEHHRHNSQMERVNLNHFKFFPTRKVGSFQATQHEKWHLYIISVFSSKKQLGPKDVTKDSSKKSKSAGPQPGLQLQVTTWTKAAKDARKPSDVFRYNSSTLFQIYIHIASGLVPRNLNEGCYTQGTLLLQCFPRNNGEDEAGLEFDANLSNMPEVNQPATP